MIRSAEHTPHTLLTRVDEHATHSHAGDTLIMTRDHLINVTSVHVLTPRLITVEAPNNPGSTEPGEKWTIVLS